MWPFFKENSISFFNSSTEPMHKTSFPSSLLHIGIGIPQKRDLERFQSLAFSSQFPNRPVPVDSGFQLIDMFSLTMLFLKEETFMNQESKG